MQLEILRGLQVVAQDWGQGSGNPSLRCSACGNNCHWHSMCIPSPVCPALAVSRRFIVGIQGCPGGIGGGTGVIMLEARTCPGKKPVNDQVEECRHGVRASDRSTTLVCALWQSVLYVCAHGLTSLLLTLQ